MPPKRKASSTAKSSPAKKPATGSAKGGKAKKEEVKVKAEPSTPTKGKAAAPATSKGKVKAEPVSPSKTLGDKLREEESKKKLSASPKKYKVDNAYSGSVVSIHMNL